MRGGVFCESISECPALTRISQTSIVYLYMEQVLLQAVLYAIVTWSKQEGALEMNDFRGELW